MAEVDGYLQTLKNMAKEVREFINSQKYGKRGWGNL
jgi:hypothetical protein